MGVNLGAKLFYKDFSPFWMGSPPSEANRKLQKFSATEKMAEKCSGIPANPKEDGYARFYCHFLNEDIFPGPEVIKLSSCSTQLSMKF